jgi:hypothetical protein
MLSLALALALAQQPADARAAWERFPVLVWTQTEKPVELVAEFGGACVQRTADARWLDERGLDWFVFNAPGRDDLHLDRENERYQKRWKRWYETRDPELLVREPCLADPATRERLDRLLDESLAARGGRTGLGVSLGDEIGLTPGGAPDDVCQCARCEAAWQRFLERRGEESIELAGVSTDATRLALADGDTSALAPWIARREFHQRQVLDVVAELAQRVRKRSPGTPVGLLGLSAQTAFGGVAIERVLPLLDFVECYSNGNARELAFTLRKPEQRVVLTIFDDPNGPDFAAWQAWEHWMRGGDGLVVWSEKELTEHPEFRARLARAVRDIREVQEAIGRFRPEPRGIAVVHDFDSLAASWMRDAMLDGPTWPKRLQSHQEERGSLESARRRGLDALENEGTQPGALPLDQVGAEIVARFPVLVLDHVAVLDEGERERIASYVEAGGALCVGDEVGWIDERGAALGDEQLAVLRERPPNVVRRAPAAIPRAWLEAQRVELAPFELGESLREWRWIRTWVRDGSGWLCAALPRPLAPPQYESNKTPSFPTAIHLAPRENVTVQWIHPRPEVDGRVLLPAGDAAVFRLVPRRRL